MNRPQTRPDDLPALPGRRRWLGAAVALLGAGMAWPARAGAGVGEVPAVATETVEFDVVEQDWIDARRERAVPVRLYLPQPGPGVAAQVPLVLFSHGIGGTRRGYSWLGQHLAAHGIASLHPQHVGSDRQLWKSGNLLEIAGRVQGALHEREVVARVLDLRFALDRLLAGEAGARIDVRRIVGAGHSYGANSTLLAAGARVERDGQQVDLSDPRLAAAILISAPPFHGAGDPRRILAGVTLPTLHVTSTADVIPIPGFYSDAADRLELFEATASARKWLAVFQGGSHSMFTDRATTGGALLNPQVKAATQALALAFLREVFDGDRHALASWPQRHAAILARFDGVGT
jgi:predicted dienelactone hydrolase